MGLSRAFSFNERLKLQLSGESSNIFNRVNFLSDESTVDNFAPQSNGSFGTLQTPAAPRIGQLELKLIF